MSKVNHPHDHFFKAAFTITQIARGFAEVFLPAVIVEKLSLDKMVLDPTSYVSPTLKEYFSDVVYRCPYGEEEVMISLLFEHKSKPQKYPFLQLLRYMLEIWAMNEANDEPLQLILPIIVYHGNGKWHKKPIADYFEGVDEAIHAFIPQFDYVLTDLREWTDEKLLTVQATLLRNTLTLLKHHKDTEYFRKNLMQMLVQLEGFMKDSTHRNLVHAMLVYITETTDITEEEFTILIQETPQNIKGETMTLYENILKKGEERGMEKGIDLGIEKGIEKEQEMVIRNAVAKGLDDQFIAELTSLSVEEVAGIILKLGLR